MLVYDLNNNFKPFSAYKNLRLEQEINKLDILTFEIPKSFISQFKNEYIIETETQKYVVKNIEPHYENILIECKQDISDWYTFHTSLNFPHKQIKNIIDVIKPLSWKSSYTSEITEFRTITADHKMSIEVIDELKGKYDAEIRFDNKNKVIYIGYRLGEDKGVYFSEDLNLIKKDIKTESFEFATRIIPEGMNGLMINQINGGKNYLENKSYSSKTITFYWKDERYTNIQNLRDDAQKKLDILSKPYTSIETKVQDLSNAFDVKNLEFNIGDYIYLLDADRKSKDLYRVVKLKRYKNKPLDTEVTLNNKPLDLVDDEKSMIELTTEMWEKTRTRFEVTEDKILGYVETQKRYTDDSFKTYRSERKQADSRIYEAITESTTYVDPKTGKTKPIIDRQLEIDKSLSGIDIKIQNVSKATEKKIKINLDAISEEVNKSMNKIDTSLSTMDGELIAYKQRLDLTNGKLKSEISGVRKEMKNTADGIKTYLSQNYSTVAQTDDNIKLAVSGIKSDVDKLKTTTTSQINIQNNKITNAVSKANNAYTLSTQTAKSIESKVSAGDVYSLIKQLPKSVSIDAERINFSGSEVRVYGNFKTHRNGKGIHLTDNKINFINENTKIVGAIDVGTGSTNSIEIRGTSTQSGSISLNDPRRAVYTIMQNKTMNSWLNGSWGVNDLYSTGLYAMTLQVDSKLICHSHADFKSKVYFGDFIYMVQAGDSQIQFVNTVLNKKFIVDFASGSNFWK